MGGQDAFFLHFYIGLLTYLFRGLTGSEQEFWSGLPVAFHWRFSNYATNCPVSVAAIRIFLGVTQGWTMADSS